MYTFFQILIDQGIALVYIDAILLLYHTKTNMIGPIEKLHRISQTNNIKTPPRKSLYVLLTVKFLGHEIGNKTNKPIHSKVDAIQKFNTP